MWKSVKLQLNYSRITEIKICPIYCFTWHNVSLMSHISPVLNFAVQDFDSEMSISTKKGDVFQSKGAIANTHSTDKFTDRIYRTSSSQLLLTGWFRASSQAANAVDIEWISFRARIGCLRQGLDVSSCSACMSCCLQKINRAILLRSCLLPPVFCLTIVRRCTVFKTSYPHCLEAGKRTILVSLSQLSFVLGGISEQQPGTDIILKEVTAAAEF